MSLVLPLLLMAQATASQPVLNLKLRERAMGPTAVTDKDLRPAKAPDCRNAAEVQRALEQVRAGEGGDCFIRDMSVFNRR